MKKNSVLKLALALALTVVLCVAVMAVSAFAIDVSTAAGLKSALDAAPKNGKDADPYVINIIADFTVTDETLNINTGTNTIVTSSERHTITYDRSSGTQYSLFQIYGGRLTLQGQVTVHGVKDSNRAARLRAAAAEFVLDGDAIIENCSMNSTVRGGAIWAETSGAQVFIKGGTIQNCSQTGTGQGGAIACNGGTSLTISGGTITGCSSGANAGAIYITSSSTAASNFTMTGGTISNNTSTTYGAGIVLNGDTNNLNVSITGGTVSGNTATTYAGGMALTGRVYFANPVTGLKVYGNKSTTYGGGMYVYFLNKTAYSMTLGTGVDIAGNVGQRGGAIYHERGFLTIDGAKIGGTSVGTSTPDTTGTRGNYNSSGSYGGGAIRVDGADAELNIISGTFCNNKAAGVGGFLQFNNGAVSISGGTYSGNVSVGLGNGIRVASGKTLVLSGDIETGGSGNFIANAGTLQKGGEFTFTDPINIDMSGKEEGEVMLTSGAATVVAGDAALFGTATAFPGFTATAAFDSDNDRLVLHLEEIPELPTIVINKTQTVEYVDFATAVSEAAANDELELQDDISIGAQVTPAVSITFTAADGVSPTITGASGIVMFQVGSGVTLTFTDVDINGNGATNVFYVASGGTLVINAGTDITGSATRAIDNYGTVTMNGGSIYNGGTATGAAIANRNTFTMNGGEIYGNNGGNYGGAIYAYASGAVTTTINGGKIHHNTAVRAGGAMYIEKGNLTLGAVEIYNNSSSGSGYQGGAIAVTQNGASLTATGTNIHDNTAAGFGGAIATSSSNVVSVTLTNCTIEDNTASSGSGGAVYASGALTIDGCTISGSSTSNHGGAIYAKAALSVDNSTISGNTAVNQGGAIYAAGNASVTDTVFSDNTSTSGKCPGIYLASGMTLTLSGDIDTGSSANFILSDGGTVEKGGAFTFSDPIDVDMTGASDGDVILASGDGTVLAADADLFTVSTVFDGFVASVGFDTDSDALILVLTPDFVPVVINRTTGVSYPSFAAALTDAAANDVLEIQAEDIDISAQVTPSVSLSFTAAGGVTPTLTRSSGSIMFQANSGITLTFTGIKLNANGAANIFNIASGGTVVMNAGTEVTGSTTRAIYNAGTFTMNGGKIYGNGGANFGGAIYSYHKDNAVVTTINGGEIYNNTAARYGGAIFIEKGNLTLGAVEIYGNTANYTSSPSSGYGGAIAITPADSTLTANGAYIHDNTTSGYGGGITSTKSSISISLTDCRIEDNTATTSSGGGVYAAGALTLNGTTVSGNTCGNQGGGVRAGGTLTIENDSVISGNTSTNAGGGVYANAALAVTDSEISGNTAGMSGGGIRAQSDTAIEDSEITGNISGTLGGGIYANGNGSITGTTIINGNISKQAGGGLFVAKNLTLDGVTMTGNVCGAYYDNSVLVNDEEARSGSAIYSDTTSALTLKNVTVTGNGNSKYAVYISSSDTAADTLVLDGTLVIKDNSPSMTSGSTTLGFAPDTGENPVGLCWRLGQSEVTTVKAKVTLSSSSDVLLSIPGNFKDDLTVGKVYDGEEESTTDIESALNKFATLNGSAYLTQDGENVLLYAEPLAYYTIASANNDANSVSVKTYQLDSGVRLPSSSEVVEALTAGAAHEGLYSGDNFIGYAKVSGYDTSTPTLTALYTGAQQIDDVADISDETVYAVWAYTKTVPGASIKLQSDGTGTAIRFFTLLETKGLAAVGITNLTSAELDSGDVGYTFGMSITKDYGAENAKTREYAAPGGKTFDSVWNGDAHYDGALSDRVKDADHAFSFALGLTKADYYGYNFTPQAWLKVQYSDGTLEQIFVPIPTVKADPADPESDDVIVTRSATQVAAAYANWLVSAANPNKADAFLGIKEAQISALETIADGTFDLENKTFAAN